MADSEARSNVFYYQYHYTTICASGANDVSSGDETMDAIVVDIYYFLNVLPPFTRS